MRALSTAYIEVATGIGAVLVKYRRKRTYCRKTSIAANRECGFVIAGDDVDY